MIWATNILTAVLCLALGAIIERRANSKRFVPVDQRPNREPSR